MEDISAKIAQILSDEESMQQIMGMISLLGGGGEGNVPPDLSALLGALGGMSDGEEAKKEQFDTQGQHSTDGTGIDLGMIGSLGKMLGQSQQHDKNIELLLALRPYFNEPRKSKVDEAIKLLKMLRLLPILRESGILDGVLGGNSHGG
ncbi:MAG: hypothetical protein VB100_03810 [Angelakisella sp.]|nr:hypothetical protein [Angelakisella sp.]